MNVEPKTLAIDWGLNNINNNHHQLEMINNRNEKTRACVEVTTEERQGEGVEFESLEKRDEGSDESWQL